MYASGQKHQQSKYAKPPTPYSVHITLYRDKVAPQRTTRIERAYMAEENDIGAVIYLTLGIHISSRSFDINPAC